MQEATTVKKARFSVAPMMDWTDRHCRYFHRQLTQNALLHTEMVVADAAIKGDRPYLLDYSKDEHPISLQLGGSDPKRLAEAVRIAADWNYDEINLNVGCPSDRVQSGTFGACLMREPGLVARCVEAMVGASDIPVTVKCRIGVDEQDTGPALDAVADGVFNAGASALWVHARKAWLEGLSPKQNREIPPLDYARVHKLKQRFPHAFVGINGGIADLDAALLHLDHCDGVMLGRAAYHNPALLLQVDQRIYGRTSEPKSAETICANMAEYAEGAMAKGARLHHITRHMLGLFHGQSGARRWRQILTVEAAKPGVDPQIIVTALASRPTKSTDFDLEKSRDLAVTKGFSNGL